LAFGVAVEVSLVDDQEQPIRVMEQGRLQGGQAGGT
jgi:hypothetical protein